MTFGERLRELRKAKSLTQRGLAREAGISFAYVSKLETGTMSPPRHKTIMAIASALGSDDQEIDELFGLACKLPHDLLSKVDAETIRRLRSLGNERETGRRPKAAARRAAEVTQETISGVRLEIFRALVENSMDAIVVLGPKLEVLYQNEAVFRILGYRPGELAGEKLLELIHPDDMRKTAHRLSTLAHGVSDRTQLRVRHRDGTWRVIDVCACNLLQNPAVNGIVIDYRDISDYSGDRAGWDGRTATMLTAKDYGLSESEMRVLTLLAQGESNVRIADHLVVSPSTVRFHVTNIISKLGVANRTEAAALAVRRRLVG